MREKFKIEKELLFKNNIKEITSISLDREYKLEDKNVVGNFLITGDYKIHEVSINKEKFNFKIPFKHKITSDIDDTTLDVEITDFLYDYNKDDLMVNIEYEIVGDRKDILVFENEETLDEFLNKREVEVIDTRIEEIKENIDNNIVSIKEDEVSEEIKEEEIVLEDSIVVEKSNELVQDSNINIKEDLREIKTETIINEVSNIHDKFVTYKIYKIEENDTLEGIVLRYHTSIDEIKEYNELTSISVGDKIIIPTYE